MGKHVIKFGKWEGDPIEWDVLKEDNFKMMVISKVAMVRRSFNSNSSNNNWKESELRKYLQEDFLKMHLVRRKREGLSIQS